MARYIAEILLKLALNTNQSINQWNTYRITAVMEVNIDIIASIKASMVGWFMVFNATFNNI